MKIILIVLLLFSSLTYGQVKIYDENKKELTEVELTVKELKKLTVKTTSEDFINYDKISIKMVIDDSELSKFKKAMLPEKNRWIDFFPKAEGKSNIETLLEKKMTIVHLLELQV